jgi:hypothetical protein
MPQTVIHLSQHRLTRGKSAQEISGTRSEQRSPPEAIGSGGATAAGILFCLRSLLEEADAAGLPLAAAGLRVAIDAVQRETEDR